MCGYLGLSHRHRRRRGTHAAPASQRAGAARRVLSGGADGEGGGAGEGGESAEEARGRSVEDDVQRLQELNELLAREQEGERELNAELQAKRDAQRQTMSAQRESMEELENENARLRAEVAEKRAQLLQQVSLNLELAEEVKRRA